MHIGECEHGQQPAGLVDLLCLSGADELQHLGSRAVRMRREGEVGGAGERRGKGVGQGG